MNEEEKHETVQIKYKKYSIWTLLKLAFTFMLITWLGNLFAYGTVGMNHFLAKLVGIASDFTALCAACLDSLK